MKVAVLGGTGKMGRALAKQLARSNDVTIGSRDPARAKEAARLSGALAGKVAVSVINPLKSEGGLLKYALAEGSAAEELARLLPESRVATAFNHVSSLFFEREEVVPMDILVAADSTSTYDEVARLVKSVPNLRPLYAGPLSESRTIEMMTPMMLNLSKLNRTGSLTTRFATTRDATG